MKRLLLILGLVMVLLGGSTEPLGAFQATSATPGPSKDTLAFEIYPKGGRLGDYFKPKINAGETTKLTVTLANKGNVEFDARTYAVNAKTAVNGGFSAEAAGTRAEGATKWLDYPTADYTIEPGKGIERTFQITVPRTSKPGQYLTAIVLENKPRSVVSSKAFQQVVRFPVPVFITVPGPSSPAFAIGDITMTSTPRFSQLDIQIANSGNVYVRPTGTVTVSDLKGGAIYSAPVQMGQVFAHDTTVLQIGMPPLAEGKYQISVNLSDPDSKVTDSGKSIVTATAPASPPPPPPVQLTSASAQPLPDASHVQFLDVKAMILNSGEALTNVRVVLHATKDGKVVEDFALNSSLSIPNGETPIEARYLPATGWTSGDWSFTLSVEAVTGGNGVAQVLATADLGSITIP